MSLERLGIFEERQADRQTFARFLARPDRIAVKSHHITVDLTKPQERKVVTTGGQKPAPVIVEPPPVKILEPLRYNVPGMGPTIRAILVAVAEAFNVSVADLLSRTRNQRVGRPRFAACKLLRDKRKMSYPQIGFSLGKRDHSSAIHEYRRATALLIEDARWAADYHAAELALCRPQ